MAGFLIDTDVLIDISRGNGDDADFVDALPEEIFISRISAMELIIGARNKRDQKVIEGFISLYSIKELSDSIGQATEAICEVPRFNTGRCADSCDSNRE